MSKPLVRKARKYLSADALIDGLRRRFEMIADQRRAASVNHSLPDCLMAAFAMFSLKEPSLLAIDARRQDQSLMNLYRIQSIPSVIPSIAKSWTKLILPSSMNASRTSLPNCSEVGCSSPSSFTMVTTCWRSTVRGTSAQPRFPIPIAWSRIARAETSSTNSL